MYEIEDSTGFDCFVIAVDIGNVIAGVLKNKLACVLQDSIAADDENGF